MLRTIVMAGILAATTGPGPSQNDLQTAMQAPPVRDYISAHQATFGGEYLATGRWVVQFTADVDLRRAELQQIFAYPAQMDVQRVGNTWTSLQALTMLVRDASARIAAQGVTLYSWGPDPYTNSVIARVAQPDEHAREVFRSLFPGAPIEVTQGTQAHIVPFAGVQPAQSWSWVWLLAIAAVLGGAVVALAATRRRSGRDGHPTGGSSPPPASAADPPAGGAPPQ